MTPTDSVTPWARTRASRGIALDRIAGATKISVRFLLAIESGEFRKLPGGIYNRSYIRQYCQAIDFDEATVLEMHEQTI